MTTPWDHQRLLNPFFRERFSLLRKNGNKMRKESQGDGRKKEEKKGVKKGK